MKTMKRILMIIFTIVLTITFISGCKDDETKYTITFISNGGTSVEVVSAESGTKLVEPTAPSREGYNFLYWCGDEALTTRYYFMSMPSQNITLYAKWQPHQNVLVTYDTDGGNAVQASICPINSEFTLTSVPEKENYDFDGWYLDNNYQSKVTTLTVTTENVTVYAKWNLKADKAIITYHTNTGNVSEVVDKGSTFEGLEDGLQYDNWYSDENYENVIADSLVINDSIDVYGIGYTRGLKISNGSITSYTGDSPVVIVPEIYQNAPVTVIASNAFYNNMNITDVVLPASISEIGSNAFYKCRYLVNINLSNNLKTLGSFAFYECERLTSIGQTLGTITIINEGTFLGCTLLEEVVMPNTVKYIEDFAFGDCENLETINLSTNLETIGEYAFVDCAKITSFVIPASTTRIDTGAFRGCLALQNVEVIAGNSSYITVDGNLLTANRTTLILYVQGEKVESEYTIPASVHTIRANAFYNNQNIKSLDVSNVETLEKGCLFNMLALEELTIASIANNYTDEAFIAYFFGAGAAEDNGTSNAYVSKNLRKITFTTDFAVIPDQAFYGISSLKEIAGIEEVREIGDYAYAYTGIEEVNIPSNIESIAVTAFYGCENLIAYQVSPNNQFYQNINGCLYDKEGKILYSVPTGLTAVEFPASATTISKDAFNGTYVETLEIPSSIRNMEKGALNGTNHLIELSVPYIGDGNNNKYMLHLFGATKSITSEGRISFDTTYVPASLRKITITGNISKIDEFAFYALRNVDEINISSTITEIERYGYYGSGISEYTFSENIITVGDFAFGNCVNITEAYLPSTIQNLGNSIFSGLPNLTKIEFEEGIETIPAQICFPYVETNAISIVQVEYIYYSSLAQIIIPNSVKEIGDMAFPYAGVYNNQLVSCSIIFNDINNSKLETIGTAAFENAALGPRLVLPSSVKKIAGEAFAYCANLTSIEIGNKTTGSNLTEMVGLTFYNCSALTNVTIYKTINVDEDVPTLTVHSFSSSNGQLNEYMSHFAGCPTTIKINVYKADKYKDNTSWSEFVNYIYEIEETV